MKRIFIVAAVACMFSACRPSVNITVKPEAGDADFSYYMAIGNSLTAGYSDNSLYVTGQLNSYPQRLYEQFAAVGYRGATGGFYQPLLHSDNGYPGARLVVASVSRCNGTSVLAPIDLPTFSPDAEDAQPYVSEGPNGQINNIAVPGIRVADMPVAGYANFNPYAARFYSNMANTPMEELSYRERNLHPTFFTMWLGSNDVMGYALAGGQGDGTGSATPISGNLYNTSDITPTAVFKTNFEGAVDIATSHGAKGMLLNVPDVTDVPFFNTVKTNGLYIPRQTLADSLTAKYGSINYSFQLGYNYFIIEDHNGNVRQAVPGEYILLTVPMDSIICAKWGSFKAIPKEYVLTTDEVQNIRNATARYNEVISGAAIRYKLGYVDMGAYIKSFGPGTTYNGVNYTTSFISGGLFSLDGVHLTPRGYALVANKIITDINSYYHSTLNTVDPNKYHGVMFP